MLAACQPGDLSATRQAPTKSAIDLISLNGRTVTIAINQPYPPFNYVDAKTGKPEGWDYETWDEICKRIDCKPVYKEVSWKDMIQAVAEKQFDAAADGITNTPERAKVVDFSIGYIKTEQRLLVRKGETRFKSIEDIVKDTSLRLGTQTGTTNYETAIKYLPEDRIKAFVQFPFAIQALIAKDIDAVIIDTYAGIGYTGENKESVELIGPSISSEELGFIFAKDSELVRSVNDALQSMINDGTLDKINDKYFSQNVSSPSIESSSSPTEIVKIKPSGKAGIIPDLKGREVTIAVEKAYLPFNYIDDKTGQTSGWDYETWDEICKRLNCKPIFKETEWEGMIQAVADKQFDVAADGIIHTPERAKIVDFSISYLRHEERLLVRKGENRFTSIEDIAEGHSFILGALVDSEEYETAVKYISEERIMTFENVPSAIQTLVDKIIDAVIVDTYNDVGYTGKNKDRVEFIGPAITTQDLGFIFPKESDLLSPVDYVLQAMIEDGTLKKINEKYFGSDSFVAVGD